MDHGVSSWQGFLEHAEMTDVGLRRANNQDSYGLQLAGSEENWQRRGHLFVVADGMGAHAAGELASKLAVDTVTLNYYKTPEGSASDALRAAVVSANSKIHNTGEDNSDFRGMGTTCSVLLFLPSGAVAAHVGDSRVYRLRGNKVEQISRDHSLVWEMMAQRNVTETEITGYVPKNIITRSLGPAPDVTVDLEGPYPLETGDTFLLCSDGLSGQVRDEEIGAILNVLSPTEAARVLIDLANLRGGPDNITVIVAKVNQTDPRWSSQSASKSKRGSVHLLVWVAMGVFAMLAGFMWMSKQLAIAVGAGVMSLGAMAAAAWQWLGLSSAGSTVAIRSTLGGGPYRTYDATPTLRLIEGFQQLIEPVCQTAQQQQWAIDWSGYEKLHKSMQANVEKQDYAAALRDICRAIAFLMQEVRNQRDQDSDESA